MKLRAKDSFLLPAYGVFPLLETTASSTVNYDTKKGRKNNNYPVLAFGPPSKEIDVIYKGVKELHHYTEMRFTNFLSGRFVTITIVNPPDENRVCHTSVQ